MGNFSKTRQSIGSKNMVGACFQDAPEAWRELRSSMAEAVAEGGDLKAQALLHWMKLEAFLGTVMEDWRDFWVGFWLELEDGTGR